MLKTKKCSKCKRKKPLAQFYKYDGKYTSECKDCRKKSSREYYAKHRYEIKNRISHRYHTDESYREKTKRNARIRYNGFDPKELIEDINDGLSNTKIANKYKILKSGIGPDINQVKDIRSKYNELKKLMKKAKRRK